MKIELTAAAGRDIEQIFEFGIERFGLRQARLFQSVLRDRIDTIGHHPLRYPLTEKYGVGIRRSVLRPCAIYYRVIGSEHIRIMRILSRQNPSSAFE